MLDVVHGEAVGTRLTSPLRAPVPRGLRWIGGGDAKLIAASCLWLGFTGSGVFLLQTGVCGGAFCLLLLTARKHLAPLLVAGPGWVTHLMQPKGDIPYGVAIAAGALLAFPASDMVARFSAGL